MFLTKGNRRKTMKKSDINDEIAKQKAYEEKEQIEKARIKAEPRSFKKFWDYVIFYTLKPIYWAKENIKDWRTAIIFLIVMAIMSSEVWVFYLLGVISWGSEFSKWCFGVASACWLFWLGPFTPFLPLCIIITAFIKGIINKIRFKKQEKINIIKESNKGV